MDWTDPAVAARWQTSSSRWQRAGAQPGNQRVDPQHKVSQRADWHTNVLPSSDVMYDLIEQGNQDTMLANARPSMRSRCGSAVAQSADQPKTTLMRLRLVAAC